VKLGDLTWTDLCGRAASLLLAVPVGSTEQHGPHLPLSTDTDIAAALCERLAQMRDHVVVAPPVSYGSAGEHAGFAGTLSIGGPATTGTLIELGRSADTFAGVLFVSAHGGNSASVRSAVSRLVDEGRTVRAWSPSAGPGDDAHAGLTETSVMLALRPEAVRAPAAVAGCTASLREILPALQSAGVAGVSPNGVLGDPAGASAARGHALLEAWTASLLRAIDGWPVPA
jgi:mycofactocin system creatininase family protein